jgi:hypothetical protein
MNIIGDAMLKLVGVESNGEYEPRAIVLKEKDYFLILLHFQKIEMMKLLLSNFRVTKNL